MWRTAGQPPGGDSSRSGNRWSIHHEAMAPSAGCARSRRADCEQVSNQGRIAHQLCKAHKAARRAEYRGGGRKDSRVIVDGYRGNKREFSFVPDRIQPDPEPRRRYPGEGFMGETYHHLFDLLFK